MFNWHLNLPRLFQMLSSIVKRLWKKLGGDKEPHQQLTKTCQILKNQLAIDETKNKVWKNYEKALSLARKCSCEEVLQVISRFDSHFTEAVPNIGLSIGQTISFLVDTRPQTSQNLDAAWQISQHLNDLSNRRQVQQQICIQIAQIGNTNILLSKLIKRRAEGTITATELSQIINKFLERHSFQIADPWQAFFQQLEAVEIPPIHQVYAVLERYAEASELAEIAKDFRSAIRYLMFFDSKEIAFRILDLSKRLGDENAIAQAHQKIGESLWQENVYTEALEHFKKAGNLEGISNCYQKLGDFGLSIQFKPVITYEWIQDIRSVIEQIVRNHIENKEFLAAIQLLKSLESAWRKKSSDLEVISESDRTQRLLYEAVRTARSALSNDLQISEGKQTTEIYQRWSLIEEAAGNYLEAGLQAEKAQDYLTASLLFEKAGAFGQALVALESAPNVIEDEKKAQLLEQGGDFFMAALLYERLGKIDQAIASYKQANEFYRAAELLRQQLGDDQAIFDEQFKELLKNAGRSEQLAQLCATKAHEPQCSSAQKARLWRRIKELGEQGLIEQRWLDMVATELPSVETLDRRTFEEQVQKWAKTATKKVLADYIDAFGLDLGTSNSVICLYNKKQAIPEIVEWRGKRQIPSIFAIDQTGREIIGIPISEILGKSPRAIVTKAKREMGTDRKFRAGGQDYRPEEISARIINCARQIAKNYLQQKIAEEISAIADRNLGNNPPQDWVTDYLEKYPPPISLENAVITVPAYFNDAQKQATKTAGVLAGINILRLIHEPTAACLAQRIREATNETILVADLGAGTFDLSVIEAGDRVFEVIEIHGDNTLGSADLDEILYTHFLEVIQTETGQDITGDRLATTRLRQACEELKIQLSSCRTWTIDLPYLINNQSIQLSLTREELERLASPWLQRIRATCEKVTEKPHRILLIGGGSIMPAVHRCIEEILQVKPSSDMDSLTAVARGAAIQAAICMGDVQGILLLDVVPFSLGIKCQTDPGQFKFDPLISKHTAIPTKKTKQYSTVEDNQTLVKIEIFQGESQIPEENFKIGQFILQGIPLAKAGIPQIDVTFDIDSNCILTVTALDTGTGNQCRIAIADSHLLTPAQADFLQTKFQNSQSYQVNLTKLEKLVVQLRTILEDTEKTNLLELSNFFVDRLRYYESRRQWYLPTIVDNDILLEIYRSREELATKTRLTLDQWGNLSQNIHTWLQTYNNIDWRSATVENQIQQLLNDSEHFLRRTIEIVGELTDLSLIYRKWLNVIENLPVNPQGNPEELTQHFLSLKKYSEASTYFQKIDHPLTLHQIELGLEIFARSRQRDAYIQLLIENDQILKVYKPDFENLNHSVRIYSSSVVLIRVTLGASSASGSGFFISSNQIATNRHVLIDETTGQCVSPESVCVITKQGVLQVAKIYLPTWGADDVAILCLVPDSTSMTTTPLRLGFSELIEVGEQIMTIGFPTPDSSGFEENLYCNKGLINRIRQDQSCTERILEISIQLQGGISGAPILNKYGEVIGLSTFSRLKQEQESVGQIIRIEQSFYAVPVQLLHRLCAEIEN
ncbi:Hsp70 family protein [Anabaena sp. FACHB-1237]|uniref:Hsp70 family protein n=1 Tax=Anabaena sp. FACHB-1237 TaxID=2692769 RepID=UPI0016810953|nr:Hsp70 family protein [Anabaena sp. FACHB-1237]MBD2138498.1 Hsp70 family protein [Anabaena sp. FACHB-1237]